ncbi:MAG: acylneuraminate cytidylyltransferase family protein [Thermoplasmatales archaeon]|nr:acylneuraminate cytidylyltransferase family protein [Thermoplasmatales archaeon]
MKSKIVAFIPARGGSKGLIRKNIKHLLGKPLIAWTIEQAKKSKYIDKVVVSTEDEEIAEISKKYGAEVIKRPGELAKDDSPTSDAIMHAINWFEERGEYFEIVVLLEPTSPLRDVEDIDKCVEILIGNPKAKAIVGVAKLESSHPEFNMVINEEGFIRKTDGTTNFKVLRRQDLEDVYFFEGSIYISEVGVLKQKRTFYHELTLAYVVPKYKSLEVDELCDFICIEALMKAKKEGRL